MNHKKKNAVTNVAHAVTGHQTAISVQRQVPHSHDRLWTRKLGREGDWKSQSSVNGDFQGMNLQGYYVHMRGSNSARAYKMCKERGRGSWIESKANANTRRFGHRKPSRKTHSLEELKR